MLSILVTIAKMTKNPSKYIFLKMEQCIKTLQEVNQSISIDYWMFPQRTNRNNSDDLLTFPL